MSLRELQSTVDAWIQSIGVRYFSELTNLAVLMEEVGELSRIFARTFGDQSFKKSDTTYNLSDEMADILFVLVCLANQTGVDLQSAMVANLEKKTQRDRDRHRSNPKLNVDSSSQVDNDLNRVVTENTYRDPHPGDSNVP
ncbi:MAG: nucleotide pyrophosphohydrolase [Planctomycetes bacterium]|nr:nucleotide pyrophosphohydrolase [Planctomycetota bacterium]